MTDAMGQFVGGGKRSLPPSVIKTMKKNMKKVPVIQEKSEEYHKYEKEAADKLIEEQLERDNEQ